MTLRVEISVIAEPENEQQMDEVYACYVKFREALREMDVVCMGDYSAIEVAAGDNEE